MQPYGTLCAKIIELRNEEALKQKWRGHKNLDTNNEKWIENMGWRERIQFYNMSGIDKASVELNLSFDFVSPF